MFEVTSASSVRSAAPLALVDLMPHKFEVWFNLSERLEFVPSAVLRLGALDAVRARP